MPAVARLLSRGFPNRSRRFWLRALTRLEEYQPPEGLPKYGYLLETNGEAVGAILLIFSTMGDGEQASTRCNLSSWYVDPAFRTYATLLVSHALCHRDVTYLNVSAAPHTWPIIEAQGFARYCDGIFIAAPILQAFFKRVALPGAQRCRGWASQRARHRVSPRGRIAARSFVEPIRGMLARDRR